ncbi:MAG: 3-hydroxyacyl-CoA dehydrogenase family protein [Sporolactobacillus sp.]|jgi:3-hydroxybutyryl-CoA dehydrogenase|nr:3-hydroxyacyl-CoA dehydrogenase family protein [Sporolactobacillus sp.]
MIQSVAVIGSGVMGSGIVQSFIMGGYPVYMNDINQAFLNKGKKGIENNLEGLVDNGELSETEKKQALGRLKMSTNLQEAVHDADLIIEAIPEVIAMKRDLYDRIAHFKKPEAVVSSNTSTFTLTKLTAREDFNGRFMITHFFNPAQLVPLVEIVKKDDADSAMVRAVVDLLRAIGKSPVVLKKEITGFIANRLQTALMREAFSLIGEGVAAASDVDTVITDGPGFRWAFVGPTRIADFGGLDTWKRVFDNIAPDLNKSEGAPELINRLVEAKKLGTKTGEGLYQYQDADLQKELAERDRYFLKLGKLKKDGVLTH